MKQPVDFKQLTQNGYERTQNRYYELTGKLGNF
jgi:hypothetical protein